MLKTWSSALSPSENADDEKLVSDLFTLTVSWVTFGEFLTLRLPLNWTEMGTKKLIFQPAEPDPEKVSYLAQKYHLYIEDHLRQLADDPQCWSTATALFEILIRGTNQYKMSLFFLLLDSPIGQEERNVHLLLQRARLTLSEKAVFLERYGPYYLPDQRLTQTLLAMFGDVVNADSDHFHKEKMHLLFSWLASPHLVSWLDNPQTGNNLAQVLDKACLNTPERVTFLRYHGERYLSLYPQLPILSNYVQDFLEYLRSADMAIFRKNPSLEEPSTTESLLSFLTYHTSPGVVPERVSDWYSVARFVRQPSRLKTEWKYIGPGIGHLVNISLPISMRPSLMKELALACIANEDEVTFMLNTLLNRLNTLTRSVQEELLYRVAESARESISEGHSTKTLLVPCIQYALEFKHVLYQQGARQDMFVHTFMTTLNIDEKTRNWLDTQAKRWSPDISAAWKKFSAHHSPLAPPTFFERIELSWERRAAFRQIKAAIQHRASQRKEGSDS